MDIWNLTCCTESRQTKTSPTKIYSMGSTKSRILGNKDPTMKTPYVSGASSTGITPFSAISLHSVNYVWVVDIAKINAATHTNVVRLPSHVEFVRTTPGFTMLAIHEVVSIVTLSR
jgi:hypothetical protein